jgi:hypothetical protein
MAFAIGPYHTLYHSHLIGNRHHERVFRMTKLARIEDVTAIPGITWNPIGFLRCETPEALQTALEALKSTGYSIESQRDRQNEPNPSIYSEPKTIEEMEQLGEPLWYAHLDIRRTKCRSCKQYINISGVRIHGHLCEYCSDVTYKELVRGTEIEFGFTADQYQGVRAMLRATVGCWEAEAGKLYLQPIVDFPRESARSYLLQHRGSSWKYTVKNGVTFMLVEYHIRHVDSPKSNIYISRKIGGHQNFTEVLVWNGLEYATSQQAEMPFPSSIQIYEEWHRNRSH